ncbi:restriction endonuclease subunit S [Propionivibrio limicola]|uniref:restriction endonuclease subunit S n=1 Tax=Propionivibrio limicola TaxID=167645 RepID=UPI0012919615|nr:restriction endonuclease subunit S [Propionivibrio limicola]
MNYTPLKDVLESWDAGAWGEPADPSTGVSVLRSTNFRSGGELSFENQAILSIDERTYQKKKLYLGDLLLERSGGGPLQPVGRVAGFWETDERKKFICGNFISRLVPKRSVVDPLYLMYSLSFWHVRGDTEKYQTATTGIRNLQMKQYLEHELHVPNIEEQHLIAARLKAQLAEVETARQAAQVQVRDADLLCTALIDAAFAECNQWQPIGAVAKVQSGYAFKSEDFTSSGIRLLRNTNILPGKVYWDDVVCIDERESWRYPSYALEAGDILISLDRPLISSGIKVARVRANDLPALLLQRVGRFLLKPGLIDPDFLYAFLQSSYFIQAISGHDQSLGVPHISPGQVEAVMLPLLLLDEQRNIASRLKTQLAEAAAIAQAAAAQLAEIERLPQKLLAQAFTPQGETE